MLDLSLDAESSLYGGMIGDVSQTWSIASCAGRAWSDAMKGGGNARIAKKRKRAVVQDEDHTCQNLFDQLNDALAHR